MLTAPAVSAQPSPETMRAFQEYASAVETRIANDRPTGLFVRVLKDAHTLKQVRSGVIVTVPAVSLHIDPGIAVPGGQVQHWIGAGFLPDCTIARVLPGLQDYDNRKRYMQPAIVDSRLEARHGDDFEVYLRLQQKSLLSALFDVKLRIVYHALDATRLAIDSKSESVREVPQDRGFMWALDDYWRFLERDGGVYVECEALVLSRQSPPLLRWIANGIIARASQRMLAGTLRATLEIMRDTGRSSRSASVALGRAVCYILGGRQRNARYVVTAGTSVRPLLESRKGAGAGLYYRYRNPSERSRFAVDYRRYHRARYRHRCEFIDNRLHGLAETRSSTIQRRCLAGQVIHAA